MVKRLLCAVLLTCAYASAQQINPSQIQPGSNGQVLGTQSGKAQWVDNSGGGGCAEGTCVQNAPTGTQTVVQPAGTQFLTNIQNGSYYAAQFGSTDGIATAISDACTGTGCDVIAGSNYANTELLPAVVRSASGYGTGNYLTMPNWPGLTRLEDDRAGFRSQIFDAPTGTGSYYPSATGPQFPYGLYFNSAYDVTIPGNSVVQNTYINQSVFNGPGNQINGFGGVNLKSYDFGPVMTMISSDQGQHILSQHNLNVTGVGDAVGDDLFVTCDGGASTYNDEGCHMGDRQASEDLNVFAGSITSTPTSGANTFQTNPSAGTGTQGDGRYIIDTTSPQSGTWPTAYVANTIPNNLLSPPMENFVGTSFASGWVGMVCDPTVDTCNNGSDPTGRIDSVAGGYAPGPITFDIVTSAPSMRTGYATSTTGLPTTGIACIADSEFFETTTYTVDSSSTITLDLRKPHNDGMTVGIGGQCQTGLEVTGATYTIGSTKYRQVWPVVGNFNGTQLIVFDHDSQQGYSNAVLGNNSTAWCSTDPNPVTFNVSGAGPYTITVFESGLNSPDPRFAGRTAIVTTPNSTYNGTVTLTYTTGYNGGEWEPAYQYTLASAPTGAAPTSGTIQSCNTGYNLYPALEVLNVLNPSTKTVDGYFNVAPNSIVGATAFQNGDTVEEPHYFWEQVGLSGGLYQIAQMEPRAPLNTWMTAGLNYTNLMSGGYIGWSIENSSPQDLFAYYGGTAPAPEAAYVVGGLWKSGIEWTQPPSIGLGAMLEVDSCQPSPYGCTDPLHSPITIYSGPGPNHQFYDNTYSNAFTFGTYALQLNNLAFPSTMFTPIFGTMAFSTDLSNFTPDGTVEAENFQFWSSFTPPTNYQHVAMYGDSGTSLGMQFLTNDGGVHQTYQGGNLSVGSLQLYIPGTVSAAKSAGISTDGTAGDLYLDGATKGDKQANVYAKSLTLSDSLVTPSISTSGSNPSFITGTASNSDIAGQLTLSSGSASYTFANTYTSAPICVATDTTAANAIQISVTTTTLTLTGTGTDVLNYICVGRN